MGTLNISPQARLTFGLVALLISSVLIADLVGLLPRPEEQIRESRRLMAESLAVQLSSAAATGGVELIERTVEELVRRNDEVLYAGMHRNDGQRLASFGETEGLRAPLLDLSSFDNLVIPIFNADRRWGEVRLAFAPTADWGLRYLGIPADTMLFILFIASACLATFYLFMRKALAELNPTKAVPERVNAAFDVLAEGVLILDEKDRIVLANRSIARVLGEDPQQMIGKNPTAYEWDLSGDGIEELPWQTASLCGEHVMGIPLRLQLDGDQLAFTVNAAPIEDGHGHRKGVLITFDDVTPLEAKNAELAKMLAKLSVTQKIIEEKNSQLEILAMSDPLTGCLNRRAFLQVYEEQYVRAKRGAESLSVLMVDIDYFKRVNDSYGHAVGDQAIKLVAKILKRSFGGQEAVGRYGGEEFVVSALGLDLEAALEAAEKLRQTVADAVLGEGSASVKLTVSIGVASFAPGLANQMALIDQADRGLYKAKATGRDRVCAFDPEFKHVPRRRAGDTATTEDATGKTTIMYNLQAQLENMHEVVQRQAEEITHKSMHDELTGLPNRYLLQDRLAQAMRLSDRNDNMAAVVSISLSAFEKIYDLLGHAAADEMISEAASRVEQVVRTVDTIGVSFNKQAFTFSRIADNELAILVVDLDSVESVPKIVNRITRILEEPFEICSHAVVNDVYCGIALYPHDGREPDVLIRNASLARNYAKRRNPKSDSAYFSKDIDSLAAKNAGIAAELQKAIRDDGLRVVYQPKVDPVTGCVTGAEALVRWSHPEFGNVGPTEFITIAENIGVIDRLTDWVLSRVCDDISGGALDGLRVSVNVSPLELHDEGIVRRILRIIQEKDISPYQLEIEITESSILNNFELARTILAKLQNKGLLVVLDDFGTAYSSLNLLVEIPVDVIKVDRGFTTDLQNAPNNRAVVQAIIQMARAMGKRVVAEGVETKDERDCLIGLGCREMQGYLYAKPMPFDELCSFVDEFGVADLSDSASMRMLEKTA